MAGERRKEEEDDQTAPRASGIKRGALSFSASLNQGWQYIKAYFTGQVNRLTARSEKEASEADLQEAKMQVEATNEAERKKKELSKP